MSTLSRRDFARFLAFSGTAALVPGAGAAQGFESFAALSREFGPLPRTPLEPDEAFWQSVRARFLIPRDIGFLPGARRPRRGGGAHAVTCLTWSRHALAR
jgi:hypothetical protein